MNNTCIPLGADAAPDRAIAKSRAEKFAVTTGTDKYHPGEIMLTVTWNGSQAYTHGYLPVEAEQVAKAICPEFTTLIAVADLARTFLENNTHETRTALKKALAKLPNAE